MLGSCRRRLAVLNVFAACAVTYWLRIFPSARREILRWRGRAQDLPDAQLRALATETQQGERGNLEGAAAFALLAPAPARASVVRAAVAFQTAYDYVDTLAEQPCPDPAANARRVHLVLVSALEERCPHPTLDYYGCRPGGDDGGYLLEMVAVCHQALRELPSYHLVRDACLRAARQIVDYQTFAHAREPQRTRMRDWALALQAPSSGLHWWEMAAGGASSMSIFALFAAAAEPELTAEHAHALEHAYSPSIHALHVLLDSFADRELDASTGNHSLVGHYPSAEEAATRLAMLARRSRERLAPLPDAARHDAILAAMACLYLSFPAVWDGAPDAVRRILAETGPFAGPAMAVLRTRRMHLPRPRPPQQRRSVRAARRRRALLAPLCASPTTGYSKVK